MMINFMMINFPMTVKRLSYLYVITNLFYIFIDTKYLVQIRMISLEFWKFKKIGKFFLLQFNGF